MHTPSSNVHTSTLTVNWNGGFKGQAQIRLSSGPAEVTLPKEFGGRGSGTSPEELLLAALVSCQAATLGILLEKEKLCATVSVTGSLLTVKEPYPVISQVHLCFNIHSHFPDQFVDLERTITRASELCLISKALGPHIEKKFSVQVSEPHLERNLHEEHKGI